MLCKTCKHSHYDGIVLTCHRYPPTALFETAHHYVGNALDMSTEHMVTSRFVEVNDDDWCAEYKGSEP